VGSYKPLIDLILWAPTLHPGNLLHGVLPCRAGRENSADSLPIFPQQHAQPQPQLQLQPPQQRTTLVFAWWADHEEDVGDQKQLSVQQQQSDQRWHFSQQQQQQQQQQHENSKQHRQTQLLEPQMVPPTRAWLDQASRKAQTFLQRHQRPPTTNLAHSATKVHSAAVCSSDPHAAAAAPTVAGRGEALLTGDEKGAAKRRKLHTLPAEGVGLGRAHAGGLDTEVGEEEEGGDGGGGSSSSSSSAGRTIGGRSERASEGSRSSTSTSSTSSTSTGSVSSSGGSSEEEDSSVQVGYTGMCDVCAGRLHWHVCR